MTYLYNAGELASIIIKANEKDIEDLGGDLDSQQSYIFKFMNIAMWKLAKLAERVEYSDALTLSADGFVTFTKSGQPIELFEPKTIYMPSGQPMNKRTSDEAPLGWWKEAETVDIHVRGFGLTTNQKLVTGDYVLKYLRYPKKVTLPTDNIDFPPAGYDALIKEVSAMVKLPKNSYSGSDFFDNKAKQSYNNLTQGSISARGTGSTGQPTGMNDAQQAKG